MGTILSKDILLFGGSSEIYPYLKTFLYNWKEVMLFFLSWLIIFTQSCSLKSEEWHDVDSKGIQMNCKVRKFHMDNNLYNVIFFNPYKKALINTRCRRLDHE